MVSAWILMAQGKQAKIITRPQERAILDHLRHTRNPHRDCVLFLLSLKAGLRAKEIAALTWGMLTDGTGNMDQREHSNQKVRFEKKRSRSQFKNNGLCLAFTNEYESPRQKPDSYK